MSAGRRYWGVWTTGKLEVLERYLDGFTTTAKNKSSEILYFDLFGGRAENIERLTNKVLRGSPSIALSIHDKAFTRLRFFELDPRHAAELRITLEQDHPGRDFEVIAGDCNQEIGTVLRRLQTVNWAPAFAFIDPNGPDVAWTTLEALARFKRPDRRKVELWILLADAMFMRSLPKDGSVSFADAAKLTAMYGSGDWRLIYNARVDEDIDPAEAREEYVNLMRWRLQETLGYRWTHPLEFRTESGRPIYHMIFATDHELGTKIMTSLYSSAKKRFPAMRQKAKNTRRRLEEEQRGVHNLFGEAIDGIVAGQPQGGKDAYEYLPPWPPFGWE
ncbi:MAG: three-Cys-motif partner protein TcmP [Actinomycetota bacterium]